MKLVIHKTSGILTSHLVPENNIRKGIESLKQQGITFEREIESFLNMLVDQLPHSFLDPEIQTEDGSRVDVIFGEKVIITMDEGELVVSNFTNKEGKFKSFKKAEESMEYIKDCVSCL